jgi:acetyltransferase-like isoleucine patch superfamily enzyme
METKIWHPEKSVILDCKIGNNCIIHAPVWIGNNVKLGNNCRIQAFSFIPDGVEIGNNVFIAPNVTFTNDKKPPSDKWLKTIIEDNVSIGAGCVILPGITIGRNSTIGAGTLITKNIPPFSLVIQKRETSIMKKNKWAVIGLGFVSSRHIQSIKDTNGEILLTCDIDESKKLEYPFYNDWEKLMDSDEFKEINFVSVAVPDYLHYPIIKRALELGKKVLCEKPLTLKANDCFTLPDDGRVGVILQLRNHEEVIKMKNKYNGENGDIKIIVCREQRYWNSWQGNPAQCGGILNNIGVHYLDLILYISGAKNWDIIEKYYSKDKAYGKFKIGEAIISYKIIIQDNQEGQDRILKIGEKEISLSRQKNLAFENWHTQVFADFINGKAILPSEAYKTLKLIEELKND